MFYQACRVFGKNSTPCTEVKEDGTVLIDIDFDAQKNWQVTCDCVGILKVFLFLIIIQNFCDYLFCKLNDDIIWF